MYQYNAKVINVVDGDTVDLDVDLGFQVKIKLRVRLDYIDTEELKGGTAESKKRAKEAKAFVEAAILNKQVVYNSSKLGPYSRWGGSISYDKDGEMVDLVQELRAHGFEKVA